MEPAAFVSRFLGMTDQSTSRRGRVAIGGITLGGAMAALLVIAPASAQSPPSPRNPLPPTATQPNPQPCAPTKSPNQPRDQQAPPQRQSEGPTTGAAPPLSDKLAQSEGVLCPPAAVDPEIVAPTPKTGRMPVIPPPGSPGGDPTVRPK
jgi:hypothetical protein